jgi:hypothetical protein
MSRILPKMAKREITQFPDRSEDKRVTSFITTGFGCAQDRFTDGLTFYGGLNLGYVTILGRLKFAYDYGRGKARLRIGAH